jgi:NAD(P)-dependent dehydrogenase (short-subunit alcohol dehydrogenase family)
MAAPFPSPTKTWRTTTYPALSPTRPELSAKGKSVFITGGGTGIGAETARYFAQAGAARVGLVGRREQPLLETKASIEKQFPGVEVFTASTDVTKNSDVVAAFEKFASGGKIDVLLSNAAIIGPQEPLDTVDADSFLESIHLNLKGSMYVAQAFLKHAASDAVVIEVNSSAAHVNFGAYFPAYSIAKLGVFRLWDSLGFGHPNLSVFHIQPGVVDTDMNREAGGIKALGFEDDSKFSDSLSIDYWMILILA